MNDDSKNSYVGNDRDLTSKKTTTRMMMTMMTMMMNDDDDDQRSRGPRFRLDNRGNLQFLVFNGLRNPDLSGNVKSPVVWDYPTDKVEPRYNGRAMGLTKSVRNSEVSWSRGSFPCISC